MTSLDTKEDMEWLASTHCKTARAYKLAILHGNEDSPDKIELFAKNDYRCKPTVFVRGDEGDYILKSFGQKST